jgi:small subunit ribosomal protein S8e
MALWQGRSRRKPSGGRFRLHRGKRAFEIGREKQFTMVGEPKYKRARTRGQNNQKIRVLRTNVVNVVDTKKNKVLKTKVVQVIENPANPHYVRRNIITKGAIIETELGNARVTSRPGQHGVLNAVLLE